MASLVHMFGAASLTALLLAVAGCSSSASSASSNHDVQDHSSIPQATSPLASLKAQLTAPDNRVDFAEAKLAVDQLIEPDTDGMGGFFSAQPMNTDPLHEQGSTTRRKTGMFMQVHPGLLGAGLVSQPPSSRDAPDEQPTERSQLGNNQS